MKDIAADLEVPIGSKNSTNEPLKRTYHPDIVDPASIKGDHEVSMDDTVHEIIEQEHKFKRELWRLQKIIRRSMGTDDPLPVFNRRHFLILVKRLCKDLENSTSLLKKDMNITEMCQAFQKSTQVSHGLLCIAYADTLQEIRDYLKREMERRNDSSICFCRELHAERSLLPLHRLKYLKSLSCLPLHQMDVISSALDGCYTAISSIHSQHFVIEIDTILDLSLNMDPPPVRYYSTFKTTNTYHDLSPGKKSAYSEEHVYEEIDPIIPKPKKMSFLRRKFSKGIIEKSAMDEFIPLSTMKCQIGEIYA